MSKPTRRTAKTTVTIWPILSKDEYSRITYGTPYTVKTTYEKGSSRQYKDSAGTMYIPDSVFWYEDIGTYPSINDKIAIGDFTATANPIDVDTIESIKNRVKQEDAIRGGTPDIMVLT